MAKGYTLEELNQLPDAPKGQKGYTLDELNKLPDAKTPRSDGLLQSLYKGIAGPVANLIARPGQAVKHALGDTEPVEGKFAGLDITDPYADVQRGVNPVRAVSQDVGRGLETVALGIGGKGAATVAKTGLRNFTKSAIGQGMKTGALSGAIGGAGAGLEQKDATASSVALNSAVGGVGGAVVGGALGAASRIAGKLSPAGKAISKESTVIERATPEAQNLSKKAYEYALKKGKIEPGTFMKPAKYIPSESEKNAALKFKDLLVNKDTVKNHISVMDNIAQKDKQVGEFLKKNNSIFNGGELKNYVLDRIKDVTDISIPEERVEKLKTNLTDGFLRALKKNDMESLWQARKAFDRSIEKAFSGSPTMSKTVKREFRNAIQDFIAERTPDGVYKQTMMDMRELFNLSDVLARKASLEKRGGALTKWLKENPKKAKLIGATVLGGSTVIAGVVGPKVVNAVK